MIVKKEMKLKNSIIFKNKINLMLSQNSIEDQILNRKIDLKGVKIKKIYKIYIKYFNRKPFNF